MGRLTQENVRHCFPFVWCEGGHENERLSSLVLSGTNDCPSVGVPNKNDIAANSGQDSIKRANIITKSGQRYRRTNNVEALFLQRNNDFSPTGALRPSAVNQNEGCFGIVHVKRFLDELN